MNSNRRAARHLWFALCLAASLALSPAADAAKPAAKTPGAKASPSKTPRTGPGPVRQAGFIPLLWDAQKGRLLVELRQLDQDLLYFTSLAQGVGSIDVGLDRGQIESSAVIRFERAGPRVLVLQRNLEFRARTGNAALARSVEESFATSVLGSLPVEQDDGGAIVVDATDFFLRDATDVRGAIRRAGQGEFKLEAARSAIYLARTKAFPKNTEIDALLTFSSDAPGPALLPLLPEPHTLTVHEHHSFLPLPEPGYRPRVLDPRVGFGAVSFKDYAQPFDAPIDVAYIARWRLEKKDPRAAVSEPKQPITYYLDTAIPEPIRSATREGALWWNAAFERAGFKNALRVLDLPDDVDPMDARYSVIQWVHRSERGWSVGATFIDPRTGEILCAKPRMDSHRVRTTDSYWRALGPQTSTAGAAFDALLHRSGATGLDCAGSPDPLGAVLAGIDPHTDEPSVVRVRAALLTAHEVGHTLGLPHNWMASTYGRGSVMEYYTPRLKVRADGSIDLSDAYQAGVGSWDRHAIRWGYSELPEAQEAAGLQAIVADGLREGILFVPSTDPRWNAYDDGPDAVEWLREAVKGRHALLDRYGPQVLKPGEPVANLADRFPLIYLFHRYAIDAALKVIGGMEHTNALAGDGQIPTRIVDPMRQREALDLLLAELDPAELEIPERVLSVLAPEPYGRPASRERFAGDTGYGFDQLGAARSLAAAIVDGLIEPERAARIEAFAERTSNPLRLDEVMTSLVQGSWFTTGPSAAQQSLRRVVQRVILERLIALASNKQATPEVRTAAYGALQRLLTGLQSIRTGDVVETAHIRRAVREVTQFLDRPPEGAAPARPEPPGPPVGARARPQ